MNGVNREAEKMDHSIREWLLEDETPEVKLRMLKEYEKLPENDERVIECKRCHRQYRDQNVHTQHNQVIQLKKAKPCETRV